MPERSDTSIVLDACVLVPPSLCDLLLTLAETPAVYSPKWSDEILSEVVRNLPVATKMLPGRIASWRQAVEGAFPEALVTDYGRHIERCANDSKDRHVLAAAIEAGAKTILTFNLRDFPVEALASWDIEAIHPDVQLVTWLKRHPNLVMEKLASIGERRRLGIDNLLDFYRKHIPTLCFEAREMLSA